MLINLGLIGTFEEQEGTFLFLNTNAESLYKHPPTLYSCLPTLLLTTLLQLFQSAEFSQQCRSGEFPLGACSALLHLRRTYALVPALIPL